jgi:hypothetical protein
MKKLIAFIRAWFTAVAHHEALSLEEEWMALVAKKEEYRLLAQEAKARYEAARLNLPNFSAGQRVDVPSVVVTPSILE